MVGNVDGMGICGSGILVGCVATLGTAWGEGWGSTLGTAWVEDRGSTLGAGTVVLRVSTDGVVGVSVGVGVGVAVGGEDVVGDGGLGAALERRVAIASMAFLVSSPYWRVGTMLGLFLRSCTMSSTACLR